MADSFSIRLQAIVSLFTATAALAADGTPLVDPPRRPAWTTSRVIGSPEPPLPYRASLAFPALTFKHPLYVTCEPGSDRMLVVEQKARIYAFENRSGVQSTDLFCEIPDHDAYSICFHPQYLQNGHVFVFANGPNAEKQNAEKAKKKNRILRYTVTGETPRRVDPASRHLVIEYESNGHNGGEMAFGPDGYLYISSGDGTSDSDGDVTGQDISDLVSGVLRIDPERNDPQRKDSEDKKGAVGNYFVPRDNPFWHIPGARPELWAYGFRNPWRLCFDRKTGDLWVGDIGQDLWEMVHVVQRGSNFGWSVREGNHPFHPLRTPGPTPISPPTIEHPHSEARSITGGLVYYGERFPDLKGAYLYGDYSTGKIWGARYEQGKITWLKELADTSLQILGFAEDPAGRVYIVDYTGQIYQLEPKPPVVRTAPFPQRLSETGLFTSVADYKTHSAIVPYAVNSPLWSDGAAKQRHIALPGRTSMEYAERAAWKFPEGTVLVKTFSLDVNVEGRSTPRRIETRLLVFEQNEWVGYTYRWNDEQTDAVLVPASGADATYSAGEAAEDPNAAQQKWHFPSRAECMVCHTRAAQYVLGVTTAQLNRDYDHGNGPVNQLQWLAQHGYVRTNKRQQPSPVAEASKAWRSQFEATVKAWPRLLPKGAQSLATKLLQPLMGIVRASWTGFEKRAVDEWDRNVPHVAILPKPVEELGRLADPYDATADLQRRARSYLHANCAHCHVEAGGGNAAFNVNVLTELDKTLIVGVTPLHDRFGIVDARLIAPGEPERSLLHYRVKRLGAGRMPPLASSRVDEAAAAMLAEWIKSIKAPQDSP